MSERGSGGESQPLEEAMQRQAGDVSLTTPLLPESSHRLRYFNLAGVANRLMDSVSGWHSFHLSRCARTLAVPRMFSTASGGKDA